MDFDGVPLRDLLDEDQAAKLVLPNFQREFVWSKAAQQALLASFIADIPVGSILVLGGERGDFSARPLVFLQPITPAYECRYLLDGQQRLAVLKMALSDVYAGPEDWESRWNDVFNLLQNRWFLKVEPENEDMDLFGWADLRFDGLPRGLTPSEIAPLIEFRRVNKTRPGDWHHPYFQHVAEPTLTDAQKRLRVARAAAEEGLVPLWEIYRPGEESSPAQTLHFFALRELANKRASDLRAEAEGDPEKWVPILEEIDPEIGRTWHEQGELSLDDSRVQEAWHRLPVQWTERVTGLLERLLEIRIPTAGVSRNQPERAIAIFENINLGGTPLTVFDLVVAKAALGHQDRPSLRQRIVDQLLEPVQPSGHLASPGGDFPEQWEAHWVNVHDNESPTTIFRNQFLNLLSVFGHLTYPETEELRVEHIKRSKQLSLSAEDINNTAQSAVRALTRAAMFLQARLGIVVLEQVPYELMLLPVAHALLDDDNWNSEEVLGKLEYWYWSSLFGGAYRERQNPRCIEDIKELNSWIRGDGGNPFAGRVERVLAVPEYSDKDTLLLKKPEDSRPPRAIRDALLQFILSRRPEDLLPPDRFPPFRLTAWKAARGDSFMDREEREYAVALEQHHVIPLASAAKLGESTKRLRASRNHILNAPVNLTLVSSEANRMISGRSPSDYFRFLDELSVSDHCVPTTIGAKCSALIGRSDEEASQVYEEVLSERFDLIKNAIRGRLRDVVP